MQKREVRTHAQAQPARTYLQNLEPRAAGIPSVFANQLRRFGKTKKKLFKGVGLRPSLFCCK
jgi:hypothetical protein